MREEEKQTRRRARYRCEYCRLPQSASSNTTGTSWSRTGKGRSAVHVAVPQAAPIAAGLKTRGYPLERVGELRRTRVLYFSGGVPRALVPQQDIDSPRPVDHLLKSDSSLRETATVGGKGLPPLNPTAPDRIRLSALLTPAAVSHENDGTLNPILRAPGIVVGREHAMPLSGHVP
jgi:hypothetical protein